MRSFRRTLRRAICFELGGFIVFRRGGDLPSTRSPIEHFRQPCEIDCNLSRVVDRQEAGMSCHVRVYPTIEKAELPASGVIDGKSIWEFGDPPRPGKAAGHVEILRGRKSRRTDDVRTREEYQKKEGDDQTTEWLGIDNAAKVPRGTSFAP